MLHYFIELAVWLLLAYLIGCLLGGLLRMLFGTTTEVTAPAVAAVAEPLVTAPAPQPVAVPVATPVAPRPVAPPAPVFTPPAATAAPVAAAPRMARPRGIPAARDGKADNLLRISGVGPVNQGILNNLGVYHFDQIANWNDQEVDWVDDHMKFNGRIRREEWIPQARLLADGNEAEFTRLYGSGGEGAKASGERTARAPQPAAQPKAETAVGLLSDADIKADEAAAKSGKMNRPKGIAKARAGKADDLQRISGIGPKNEQILHSLGFFHFDQIASWLATEVAWVDDHLRFGGRIKREEWIKQARLLADGKEAEFAKLYGTGGLKNKQGEKQSGTRTRRT